MKNALSMSVAAAVVACAGSAAMADFFVGQPVSVTGTWAGGSGWGTGSQQGPHLLGGTTTFEDDTFPGQGYFVDVSSQVQGLNLLTMSIDLTAFLPGGFGMTIVVDHLKTDGTIQTVTCNFGTVTVNPDGNGFTWMGGPTYPVPNVITFDIIQSPTPGAAAVLGLGGLMAARRRR